MTLFSILKFLKAVGWQALVSEYCNPIIPLCSPPVQQDPGSHLILPAEITNTFMRAFPSSQFMEAKQRSAAGGGRFLRERERNRKRERERKKDGETRDMLAVGLRFI